MFTRYRRLLVILAMVVVVYGLAGFLIAPPLVRSFLLDSLGRTLTTRPTLGRVRINPFSLSFTLEDLGLSDAQGKPVAGFGRLYLRFDPLRSLLSRAWALDQLRIERPTVALEILPDRGLNLMRLVRPRPASKDTMGAPPSFRVHRLALIDGSLRYADRSRDAEFDERLEPIRFELADFGTRGDCRNACSFDARSDAGETVSWQGRFTLRPFLATGELTIGNLRAKTLADFLGDQVPFVMSRGTFAFHSRYRLDAAKVPAEIGLSGMGIEARDVALGDRASGAEVITASELGAEGGALDLTRGSLDLGRVRGRGANVLLWMTADGHLSFERWTQPAARDTAKPLLTTIPAAHFDGLSLEFQDHRVQPEASLGVRGGTVDLTGFSTAAGSSFTLAAACSLGAGGRAMAQGKVTPSTPAADLLVDLRGFELHDIEPYVRAFARLDIRQGTADAKGRLQFNGFGAKGPLLRFAGEASSGGFIAVDRKVGKNFLTWKRLDLHRLEYDAVPGRLSLGEIVASQPYIRMIVAPDRTTNVQALAIPPDSMPAAFRTAAADTTPMPARIDLVRVLDGSMFFEDLTLTPSFATGIRALNGTIRELSSSEAAHAAVELVGNVDAYAPAHITGTLNPLNGRGRTDLKVAFKNIELTTFSPYSGKFMGYPIKKGKLDLDLNYKIEGRQLDATNRVFMRQLTLGDKVASPDATKLPVRFAVALLKDRDGNIDLNLPVKGSLDDPKFSVFPIIMKVLIGLVTKAVASPFHLLGAVFGGGDHETPEVEFRYGSSEMDSSDVHVLEAVRKGLADKSELRLEIDEPAEAAGDSMALMERLYAATLRGAAGTAAASPAQLEAGRAAAPAGFAPDEWSTQVVRAYAERFGPPPALAPTRHRAKTGASPDSTTVAAEGRRLREMDAKLRASLSLDAVELHGLARARARRIQGFLLADSTIAPERVFIVTDKGASSPDSVGVKVGLTLTD